MNYRSILRKRKAADGRYADWTQLKKRNGLGRQEDACKRQSYKGGDARIDERQVDGAQLGVVVLISP